MYIEKLKLKNIKCFNDLELSLLNENGNPSKWITLLGENATGKTTLLQSLGLLLAGFDEIDHLLPVPDFWLKDETSPGEMSFVVCPGKSDLRFSFDFNDENSKFTHSNEKQNMGFFITGNHPLEIEYLDYFYDAEGENETEYVAKRRFIKPEIVQPGMHSDCIMAFFALVKGFFGAAYGPYRRMHRGDAIPQVESPNNKRYSGFITLFKEEYPIATLGQWISVLDYRSAKGDEVARKNLIKGIRVLEKLLPENVEFDEKSLADSGKIRFIVQGKSIPFLDLSDGYRSILALGGDLIWRLIESYPESDDPIQEEGVVLIDELDIHLHPRWQSWIAQKLRNIFPNIQFIVATHSPLVAMGAYWDSESGDMRDDVLTLKLYINNGNSTVQCIPNELAAMDMNRVLDSPAFGMVAPRPPEVENKIDRYDELIQKRERTDSENLELAELRKFMADARPIGGPPEPDSLEARIDAFLDNNLPK